ncbi:heat shock 22 kDa protein, mitochondrial-like [Cornus florida]|uniref:heat shock 22 kDa protein, mitochondrial-like n=1 Tax=Cornus florida TaxID=4283 RepID=UPI00289FAD11|nr:heat shock 22 kDa protein, mitochondrial-like [Cornus florida]
MASTRALTSSYSLASLVKLFSPMNASPILVRTLRTCAVPETTSDSDWDTPANESDSEPVPTDPNICFLVNPFLKDGPAIPYRVKKDEEAMYARLDMPGIGKEGLKLWVEDNRLEVRGAEESCPRQFSGYIKLPQGFYKPEEIAAEMKNGVLKVKVPKLKVEDRKDFINVNVK